jgi:hypothetical protein
MNSKNFKMKATLIKSEDSYILKDGLNHVLGIDDKKLKDRLQCPYLLSKQNCDEIFGVVDVDKLAKQFTIDESYGKISGDLFKGYIYGFNKAMELNKDKVFTLEDVHAAFGQGWERSKAEKNGAEFYSERTRFLKYIQQPTEIEVEIITEAIGRVKLGVASNTKQMMPKLDSSGQLILKKI